MIFILFGEVFDMTVDQYREKYFDIISEYARESTFEEWSNTEYRKEAYQQAARRFVGLYGLDAWKSLGYSK